MTKPVVVVTRSWTKAVQTAIAERFDARLNPSDRIMSAEEIVEQCQGATVLCPCGFDPIDSHLISKLPDSVKLIATISAGTQHIDVSAATQRGIYVSNTPDVVAEDTADLAVGLMISVCRRLIDLDNVVRRGDWQGFKVEDPLCGLRVWGKTVGIIGLGGIGQAVAHRTRGFRMSVLYHNRKRNRTAEKEFEARYCPDLYELLALADIVSVHCPLTPQTQHLIDDHAFAAMKPSSVLINTARGTVVDEDALIRALQNGVIAGAGLDVYKNEPEVNPALIEMQNVVLSPHIGTATIEARDDMGFRVIENIEMYLATGEPKDRVTS
ncbi:MAG: D-glycerate dehydrogenase [Acidiferrobacteraceae bacterium]|nr:D-glycerate dehydrogenase [Acidiferrobacteraceae bacterium]